MDIRPLFEAELRRRGYTFEIDDESGRHAVEIGGGRMLINLENVQRDFDRDGDTGRVERFVDAIEESVGEEPPSAERLYWCLEPSDFKDRANLRVEISNLVDRILVQLSSDGGLITWVTPEMLRELDLTEAEAGERGFANLARALDDATLETSEIDGVTLGFLGTRLPFKSSLILAPNLQTKLGTELGWPLLAVAPDRDFLYLWAAEHRDFVGRLGRVVVNEYGAAAYPISTEVFELNDAGVRAIGEFPVGESASD